MEMSRAWADDSNDISHLSISHIKSLSTLTRSDILQGHALFGGVKQMLTRGVW